jgi:RNA polymerase sigma-70 factor (ECF subfamily)
VVGEETEAQIGEHEFAFQLRSATEAAFRVVRSLGLSADDAADVIQDASIRAWRHRGQCRGEFQPWFLAIAYREARRPRRRWLTAPVFWRVPGPLEPARSSDDLTRALRALPQRQRLAVALRYEADLPVASVAQVLRISEPAAKQLLARARVSLRAALATTKG